MDEALYLAKEYGIFTTREVQLQIVRSPPFSPRERPFLLENFFEAETGEPADMQSDEEEDRLQRIAAVAGESEADPIIHGSIQKIFQSKRVPAFECNGQEWLSEAEGRGTRKRASAHVVLRRGSGIIKVNGESNMYAWWPHYYHRFDICQPFKLTATTCVYDTFIEVQGGGPGGQAGAARLAIARALLQANPGCHDALQEGFCLLEDMRQKMSKMPGKAGRRTSFSWNKR